MRITVAALAVAVALVGAGCGATTRATTTSVQALPTLTSAITTFVSRDHGKDADSALMVQLLRNNAELAGDMQSVGVEFDDNASSGPFSLTLSGPFRTNDVDSGQLRVRFTPDGDDDWTFDLNLTMRFSDGSVRNFLWRGVRLDNANPERVLALAPARVS